MIKKGFTIMCFHMYVMRVTIERDSPKALAGALGASPGVALWDL